MVRSVLHLIDTGGPGGAETICSELVQRLDPARWRSIVAVPERDWLYESLRSHGVRPFVLATRGSFDLGYLRRILGLVTRQGIDVIQAHLLTSSVYGSVVGFLRGVPVVCTFHGQADIAPGESYRAAKFRILNRRSNRIVFVSESLKRAVLAVGRLDPARVEVIFNGIDAMLFRPARDASLRAELGIGRDEILIGAIGNIRPSKDYPVLLRAAALLRRRSPAYRVVIVGQTGGALYERLLTLRDALGLRDIVRFAGFREDIHRVMNNLDVYAISSSAEGFSLSTVQALACGVPVVATRCGGPEEILEDDETGILVDAGSPERLAGAIDGLVRDPARRARLVRAGRRLAERNFSIDEMIGRYAAVYERCLEGEPHRRATEGSREADGALRA